MTKDTIGQILLRLKSLEKAGNLAATRALCQHALATYPANTRLRNVWTRLSQSQHPSTDQFNTLRHLFQQQNFQSVLTEGQLMTTRFPHSHSLYNILAAAATRLGQPTRAAAFYHRALAIDPNFVDALNNLGQLWLVERDWQAAADSFARALTLNARQPGTLCGLGHAEYHMDAFTAAHDHFQQAMTLAPTNIDALHGLAKTLMRQHDFDGAATAMSSAIALAGTDPDLHLTLARIRGFQGQQQASEQAYLRVFDIGHQAATAARELAGDHTFTADDPLAQRITALYAATTNPAERCHLAFALFKLHDDLGNPEHAFFYLAEGNRLRRTQLAYNPDQDKMQFQALHQTAPHLIGHTLPQTNATPKPIFIVGMPRSGTSLVEQILSCHSDVAAGGELPFLGRAGLQLATGKVPASNAALQTLRDDYFGKIKPLAAGKPYLTDKMPHNFRLIALIRTALPEARIIHVQRNAAAVCWSNYRHYFSTTALGYSCDLSDVVAFHQLYADLMQHWSAQFGAAIYHLDYEALTQHPEAEIRNLLGHLGLPWQAACLAPQDNPRVVRTLSQLQVRQPVYTGSSQDWRRYEPFLAEAFDRLHPRADRLQSASD